jgi:putative acetyltransferase
MVIVEISNRTEPLIEQLTQIWERSVKATYLFLSDDEITEIKKFVPDTLSEIAHLVIAINEAGDAIGFMGVEDSKIEMLFISPDERGKGLGKAFIEYGIEHFAVNQVTVNEQNPQAIGFYEHLGFSVYNRTDTDEEGRPYPLLYMKC